MATDHGPEAMEDEFEDPAPKRARHSEGGTPNLEDKIPPILKEKERKLQMSIDTRST